MMIRKSRRGCVSFLMVFSCLLAFTSFAEGAVFYVTESGAGAKDGSRWEDAYGEAEFSQNLNGSSMGDEFWVAAGRYRPSTTGDKTWYFVLDPGVSLYGGFAGTEASRSQRNWRTNVTILTGDLDFNDTVDARGVTRKASDINAAGSGNSIRVMYTYGQGGVLDGFTVTAGNALNDEGGGMMDVQSSVTVLIGMGEFFAILVAGIDLSVGAILALSGMVTAKLMLAGIDPFLAALIGGVLVGGALGAINGCLVNWTGLHPFIITLGTNAIFRGITLVISDANSVYGFSFDFVNFFAASVIGIPVPVIFSLIVALILWFLTTRMRLGRNIYALGGNKNSAFYSGIDVKFHILVVFIISGVCAGLAGVVSTARLGAAEPLAGMGFETYAIASAIIGGTSFFGGKGRIFSVVIGGLIIGTINNGLNILQVQTYYQLVVMGGLIIAAVALDRLISK